MWGIAAERIVNGPDGLRVKLFRNVLRQEVAYYSQVSTGVLVSRFSNDAERVKRSLTDFFPSLIEFLAIVIVGLVYLFRTSWTVRSIYLSFLQNISNLVRPPRSPSTSLRSFRWPTPSAITKEKCSSSLRSVLRPVLLV
jgi:ABC-type multidrug transport system fused ATPase/permease subunit